MNIKRHIIIYACLIAVLAGCSTAKNTPRSRWWHAFNARYNTYYNGSVAYIDGSLEKENGNNDNYTELIPLYTVANKSSRELGKSNFDRAIEKAQKAIQLHSIKSRPVWNKQRRKTERDREWLSRREYNPFLWKAWLLMGRAQFHEGDFDNAVSTFAYMSRLYDTQPAIKAKARAWLTKSYIENGYRYDAEDVIRNQMRDSIPWQAVKEWDYTLTDYYIHTEQYDSAVIYLRKVIRHEMRRKQKAREWYLMGQLCQALGRNTDAYNAYRHVVRMNPPYELDFHARVSMTEVLADKQSGKMVSRLHRMARSDKNKDYQDQIYYAIGNIWLAKKDTLKAIGEYERGNSLTTGQSIERGVMLLKLGDLYWQREQYSDARRCYNESLGMLDKERPDYERLSQRSKILDELVPYTDAVHLQDSLQALALLDDAHRNAAIDRVIEALKKKEREEQKNSEQANLTEQANQTNRSNQTNQTNQSSTWYFYNPTAIAQGKATFQRLWGKRDNIDNWQRNNKTVVSENTSGLADLTDEQRDSLLNAQLGEGSSSNVSDSAKNDPHRREYYLAQIPFTPEQREASDKIIADGLYNSGVIFKDKLDNLQLSEKALRRLTVSYPTFEHTDEAYYHLFLLYSRRGMNAVAHSYIDSLKTHFPKSKWTTLLCDPNYARNAREGVHLEDSLYQATYEAFRADRYAEVKSNVTISEQQFPTGANRDKFIFIGALNKLNDGESDACLNDLNTLVKNYPTSRLSEIAGMIINGVKSGRKLRGGRFDMGDVWSRRTEVLSDSAEIKQKQFSNERNTPFEFMLVYQPDSVNENKLLYQLAKYNFTSYLVRDFDIAIDDEGDVRRMRVSGFRNYDEALQYARQLYRQKSVTSLVSNARPVIISDGNIPLLGTVYSYDDYSNFYANHFAPLKVSTVDLLTEPAEIVTESPVDEALPDSDVVSPSTNKKPVTIDLDDEYYDLDGF